MLCLNSLPTATGSRSLENMCYFGSEISALTTPTIIDEIVIVKLRNGYYDQLYTGQLTNDIVDDNNNILVTDLPTINSWNQNTILNCDFNNDVLAGSVDWVLSNISGILLKRKCNNEYTTLFYKDINTVDDLTFEYDDYMFNQNSTVQYMLVTLNNYQTTNYLYATIKDGTNQYMDCTYKGNYLFGANQEVYSTFMNFDNVSTTRNHSFNTIELLNYKQPKYFSNSLVNYDTGSFKGTFVEFDPDACQFDFDNIASYTDKVVDFLTDRKPKLMRLEDGRQKLIAVTSNPDISMDDIPEARTIEFEWTEIGDVNEKTLYSSGINPINSNYWSNNY